MRSVRAVQNMPEITEHLVAVSELDLEALKGIQTLSLPMTPHPERNSVSIDFVNGIPTGSGNRMPDFEQLTGLERTHRSRIFGNPYDIIRNDMESSIAALARYAESETEIEGFTFKQRRKLGVAVVALTSYAAIDSAKLGPASRSYGYTFVDKHSPSEHIPLYEHHYRALMPFVWRSTKRWIQQFI